MQKKYISTFFNIIYCKQNIIFKLFFQIIKTKN